MDPHHRKIDLQSPADFTYLLNNIKRAATEKIDLAIPRSAAPKGEDDAYRTKVEELVQEYILSTLRLALPNLSINGFDASPALLTPASTSTSDNASADAAGVLDSDNYEPYDPRLAEKVRALYVQLEHESEDVARMRRKVPSEAAERHRVALEKILEESGGGIGGVKSEEDGGGDTGEMVSLPELQRQAEVERMWRRGRDGLEEMEGITGVIAKLEQARRAVEVVEGR